MSQEIKRCEAVRDGERCELRMFHAHPMHQIHLSYADHRPVQEWAVTEYRTDRPTIAEREALVQERDTLARRVQDAVPMLGLVQQWQSDDMPEEVTQALMNKIEKFLIGLLPAPPVMGGPHE